jgi:hypothetical protein
VPSYGVIGTSVTVIPFSAIKKYFFPALFFTKLTNGHQLHVQISYALLCERRTVSVGNKADFIGSY